MRISSYARLLLHGRTKPRPEDRPPIDIAPRQAQPERDLEAEIEAPPTAAELQQWNFEARATNKG